MLSLLKMESCGDSSEELKGRVKDIGSYGNSYGVAQTLPHGYYSLYFELSLAMEKKHEDSEMLNILIQVTCKRGNS